MISINLNIYPIHLSFLALKSKKYIYILLTLQYNINI